MPPQQIEAIVHNTIAVLTVVPEKRDEWRQIIAQNLQQAQTQGVDWQIEVEFFTAALTILEGQPAQLPEGHPYAGAINTIQAGLAAGGPQQVEIPAEVIQAVQDFVKAESWEAARRIVEAQQALLFQPEVELLFEQNITQAKTGNAQDLARMLEMHLAILRECKTNGITATFEKIAAAQQDRPGA